MLKQTRILVSAVITSLALAACGGGGGIGTGGTTGTTTGSTTGGTTITPVPRLGVLDDTQFTAGVIEVSVAPPAQLSPGGSASLGVDIVDTANGNALVTSTVEVTFSSPCTASGLASIDSPVSTSTGSVTTTYRALGCSGNDQITATATVGGESLVAVGTISVQAAPTSSIQFLSATPTAIRLRGAGQPETSVVRFQVLNTAGGPVKDVAVSFSLDTTVGGITLSPASGKTDSNGVVQTTVRSGTVATSVRVTAETGLPGIPPAQSDSLVISTGLADQDSFSLSIGCFNIEGDTIDGVTTPVNIRASDRFNNPVPDGTAVSFQTEGGSVQSQCLTTGGACSVTFTTQNPRTADHRVTLRATAIGEESFTDVNGDGRFDAGESFADLAEAFTDYNENNIRNTNEPFLDFNNNDSFSAGSGNFTGVLCDSGCDTATSLHVRDQQIIIMSGSSAVFGFTPSVVDLSNGAVALRVDVGDDAGQPMPGGTRIEAKTTLGTIAGDSSFTQACTTLNGPFPYTFVIQPPEGLTEPKSGVFTVKVTSPGGIVSSASVSVSFNPDPAPPPPPPGPLNSITFISAIPTTIGIKGTGLNEVSEVVFEVRNTSGGPLAGQTVTFSANTTVGGIQLDPVSAVTDSSGRVLTRVRSGTVQTSVRVTATATQGSKTVSTVSSELTITTGLPDQDSVSLSLSRLNVEGFDRDGELVTATIRAADRFNNPVPDGTAFAFRTSAGAIGGTCSTLDGACSVVWRSQNPRRPQAAILAFGIGEESFTDLNGDGRYDDGEPLESLAEPWLDTNLNGVHDAASEEFQDFNDDGRRNDPNDPAGLDFEDPRRFTGTLCDGPSRCDTARSLYVFDTAIVVMSGSRPAIDTIAPSADIVVDGGSFTMEGTVPTIVIPTRSGTGGTATLRIVVRDANDQPMPKDTVISLANDGGDVTITPTDDYIVPDTTDASEAGNTYTWTIVDEVFVAGDQLGALTLTVTSPSGVVTRFEFRLRLDDVTPP